jgi:hypothetical protein
MAVRNGYVGAGPQLVNLSTGNIWCSRDCLGRLIGLFLSWADVNAAEHYHNLIIALQDISDDEQVLLAEATITLVARDGRIHQLKRAYVAYDRDSDYLIGEAFTETVDALNALENRAPSP